MKKNSKEYNCYLKELEKVWNNESMIIHCLKNTSEVVILNDGKIIDLDKPKISTDFCFGYGMYLQASEEESNYANKLATKILNDEKFFINENLKELETYLKILRSNRPICIVKKYSESDFIYSWTDGIWAGDENRLGKDIYYLQDKDREKLIEGYEKVIADFKKRLNTYIKKFGLTKVNSWSYLRD